MSAYKDDVTVTITVTMRQRWLRQFLGMLDYMQYLGGIGSSRTLSFMSDGDGDFRPRFSWPEGQDVAKVVRENHAKDHLFDAG